MRNGTNPVVVAVVTVFSVAAFGTMAPTLAQEKFTGCLKSNGKIVRLQAGDSPAKACKSNQTQITLSGGDKADALVGDVTNLQGKDGQLMAKDTELMNKDDILMSKDVELMGADADLLEQIEELKEQLAGLTEQTRDVSARVFLASPLEAGEFTTVEFDGVRWDTDEIHSTTTNPSRLTAQTAGKYYIFASVSDDRLNSMSVIVNGTIGIAGQGGFFGPTPITTYSVGTHYELNVGDYVELRVHREPPAGPLGPLRFAEFGMVKVP